MNLPNLYTKRQWIAELARAKPKKVLFSLHHVIDLEWMLKAYRLTRKDGATGIDGVTAKEYEESKKYAISWICSIASSPVATKHRRCAEPTSRRQTAQSGGSAFRLSRTGWRSGRTSWCWERCWNRISPYSYGFRPGRSGHEAMRKL